MDAVPGGTIGGTYGANAVSAASALAVIDVMERDDYPAKAMHIADVVGKRHSTNGKTSMNALAM